MLNLSHAQACTRQAGAHAVAAEGRNDMVPLCLTTHAP